MKDAHLIRKAVAVTFALVLWGWGLSLAEKPAVEKPAVEKPAAEKPAAEKPPVNAAVVNGKPITYADYQRELQLFQKRLQMQGGQMPQGVQVGTEVVNDLITRELIFQESVKKGIKTDPQAVKNEIAGIQKRFGDQAQYENWLSAMGLNEEKLQEQIGRHLAIRSFIDAEVAPKVKVGEDEAKEFFTKNQNLFQRPEEVHAQHILIKVEKGADPKKKTDARKKLQSLQKRITKGEDFGELAKASSQCPSAPNKGDLGFFGKGRMVPEFEKAAFALKPGQVSDIVETQFGYHLIKVLEHRPAQSMKYEEVQERITSELRNRQIYGEVRKMSEKLRQSAKVETFVK